MIPSLAEKALEALRSAHSHARLIRVKNGWAAWRPSAGPNADPSAWAKDGRTVDWVKVDLPHAAPQFTGLTINALLRHGLLEATAHDQEGRPIEVALSAAGKKLLEKKAKATGGAA
jgi:hypothetical protein